MTQLLFTSEYGLCLSFPGRNGFCGRGGPEGSLDLLVHPEICQGKSPPPLLGAHPPLKAWEKCRREVAFSQFKDDLGLGGMGICWLGEHPWPVWLVLKTPLKRDLLLSVIQSEWDLREISETIQWFLKLSSLTGRKQRGLWDEQEILPVTYRVFGLSSQFSIAPITNP